MVRISHWLGRFGFASGLRQRKNEVGAPAATHGDASAELDALLADGADALARDALNEAESAFARALEVRHDCGLAHQGLADSFLRQRRFEEAADELQLAVLFEPNGAAAHAMLAFARSQMGMDSAARESACAAMERAGESPQAWTLCARAFKALSDHQRAAECYGHALALAPESADIACQLGYMRFLHGDYDAAREAYRAALARDPNHVATLHNLGLLEFEIGSSAQALASFERAAALSPSSETAACIGHALRDLGRLEEACQVYERVLAADPSFGDARLNLSYALLMRGEYAAGWAQYDTRFASTGTARRDFGLPTWHGEPLDGRRLLVIAEQGLGDEIMFASCIPDAIAAGAQCIVECNTRLASLFARSFPDVRVHGGQKSDGIEWLRTMPPCDYQVSIGSLPRYFRPSADSFADGKPYLKAQPDRVEEWRRRIRADDRVCVGICWRGGTLRSRQWQRSIPLPQWKDLLCLPQCRFVALQNGGCAQELADLRSVHGLDLEDLSAACTDIDELAAVVAALDLIVTVPNTLGHVAGALGQKVWILLPTVPEWRYLRSGTRMPWYGSMRLYRRTSECGAERLITQVRTDVLAELATLNARQ